MPDPADARGPATTHLPAVGRPPAPPPLDKIAIEEHFDFLGKRADYARVDLQDIVRSMDYDSRWLGLVRERLTEFSEVRLAAMDAANVSMAILSHTVPGVQGIVDPVDATTAAREINDFLAGEVIAGHPRRFAGFASVPLQAPSAAARELERAVTQLHFKGAMVNGYTNTPDPDAGAYLDDPRCLPFWEAAAALGVPVYLHPRPPLEQRIYEGHAELIGATWGFAAETAAHALRLVYSGLFDRWPGLTVILGHLGETLPQFAWRIQHCFEYNPSDKRVQRRLQDYLADNFYVTTSGNFSDQALIGAVLTIGADRILFAADYPFEMAEEAARWIERAPISEGDRRKIAAGNARRLFELDQRR
jgi:2,3-dihydroxybenzoate decarboxylase